ncbi:MAG TPA: amidohydrolase family protein [Thermoguttaceae bacterium]|nr:amidohydrolase family protein [Thermoguttaceae bacterium]
MQLVGRRYETAEPVSVEIAGGKISQVTPIPAEVQAQDGWPWIAPGLWDIQINGYGGQEFSSPDLSADKVRAIVLGYGAFGVTRCCPTLFTQSFEVMQHSLRSIAAACASPEVARRIAGIHVEGPYLSPEDGPRGAHPLAYCRPPDWSEFQRFQDAADGQIRILTMAVEYEGSPQFIERVVRSGVIVGIGHTAANTEQLRAAVDAGARLSTHLGNGAHATLPRHPNYLWDQLADDRLVASLIVDGHHLPPAVVKSFLRAKTPERCILISDLSGMAGLPPGQYRANHAEVEILPDGRLVVAGQRQILAGASRPIGAGIANVVHFAGVSLTDAISMAVHRPAELLGLEAGGLEPGDPADLVQFHLAEPSDPSGPLRFEICSTVLDGEVVFGTVWQPSA